MPFYFKPVVWNDKGYRGPAGGRFSSGFPAVNGYGHEEWNNAPALSYQDGTDRFKVFHTEPLGNQDVDAQAGLIAIMLIASNAGKQWLVGVAAGCVSLLSADDRKARLELADRLGLDSSAMADEAWALESVRSAHKNDEREFRKKWNEDFHWIPNWTCPADLYLPLLEPIALDAMALTGKERLVGMYGAYQAVGRSVFQAVLSAIPDRTDPAAVGRLKAWGGGETETAKDIEEINNISATVRAALVQARIGQGAYRADLMAAWNGRCAVTGCGIPEMLRASHVQPWRASDNGQRLDPENGLILSAHLDALFDRGLITFADDGSMLVSESISVASKDVWGVGNPLRVKPKDRLSEYLRYHREKVFTG
ncbi:HNH endonuclease [Brevundimonas sp. Marseille-Q4549]